MSSRRPILDAALATVDPDTRGTVEPALGWLMAEDADLDQLLGLHLLEFLYYQLPVKWLCEPREHHDIAWALGDLFRAAGRESWAAVCRAQSTHELLDLWDRDPEKARARMRTLIGASGLEPAENSLLDWGSVHGMTEYGVLMQVSGFLERAIDDGRLVPGARGWRARSAELTEEALRQPADDGSSPLAAVLGERVQEWTGRLGRRGIVLPDDLSTALAEPQPSLAPVGETLEPLRWLLEQIGPGMKLTTSGYLPTAVVHAADERFGLRPWPAYPVRSESDLPDLSWIRAVLERARLVTKARGRLSLSAKGKSALHDPAGLARSALGVVFDETTWEGDGAVFQACWLLAATKPGRSERDSVLHRYLTSRWAIGPRSAPEDISPHQVYSALWGFDGLARCCDWYEPETADDYGRSPELTEQGRVAVLAGLRMAAQAPKQRPMF